MAGRNHRRPSNKYGYAGSTPFAPFCCSPTAWRLSACILTPDTKSIVQARGRRVEGTGDGGEKPCAISSSAAHANAQAHAMLPSSRRRRLQKFDVTESGCDREEPRGTPDASGWATFAGRPTARVPRRPLREPASPAPRARGRVGAACVRARFTVSGERRSWARLVALIFREPSGHWRLESVRTTVPHQFIGAW